MSRGRILALTALAAVTAGGLAGPASGATARPRIVGGAVPADGTTRFMASLRIPVSSRSAGPTDRDTYCGGVLIRPDVVATAAHCFDLGEDEYGGPPGVRIGSRRFDHPRGEVRARAVLVNRSFSPEAMNARHDTALVFLERPSGHRPIPLATRPAPTTSRATVYGWGATDTGARHRRFPSLMRSATLRLEPSFVCSEARPLPGELCAGWSSSAPRTACAGDSGGPLVSRARGRAEVVGIVSYGIESCDRGWGIYADVARTRWLHRWAAQGHRIGTDFYAKDDLPAWVD